MFLNWPLLYVHTRLSLYDSGLYPFFPMMTSKCHQVCSVEKYLMALIFSQSTFVSTLGSSATFKKWQIQLHITLWYIRVYMSGASTLINISSILRHRSVCLQITWSMSCNFSYLSLSCKLIAWLISTSFSLGNKRVDSFAKTKSPLCLRSRKSD